jgi:hypothetical protein
MITISIVAHAQAPEPVDALLGHLRSIDVWDHGAQTEIVLVDVSSSGLPLAEARRHVHVVHAPSAKGYAIQVGIRASTGTHVLIHDGGLHHLPSDYSRMVSALRRAGDEMVVYGSRHVRQVDGSPGALRVGPQLREAWLSARALQRRCSVVVAWAFTGRYMADLRADLVLLPHAHAVSLNLRADDASVHYELGAKVLARGLRFLQVPVQAPPADDRDTRTETWALWLTHTRTFWRHRHG